MYQVSTEDFCREVAARINLDSEIILEIVGGIANLYLEKALQSDGIFEIETLGLISSAIPKRVLLNEIENCSGVSAETSEQILFAMQETLKDLCVRNSIVQSGNKIFIEALGEFEVKDIIASLFHLKYCDPVRSFYHKFLLS